MLTKEKLQQLYRNYNTLLFEGKLPVILIELSNKLTHVAGVFSPVDPSIRLSIPLLQGREQEIKNTLVHEMIHMAQHVHEIRERPHGPYFSAHMHRINAFAEGAVIVTVTHQLHETIAFEQSTLLSKIKKLLSLSESPNRHEAYVAAHKAQSLMAAQGISLSDLSDTESGSELDEPIVNELIEKTGNRIVRWKFSLLGAICRVNYCLCLGGGQYGIRALGRRTHIEICRSYYEYFSQLIETESRQHQGKGKVYLNRFREAMVDEIAVRLEQQHRDLSTASQAPMNHAGALIQTSQFRMELEQFVSLVYPKIGKGKRTTLIRDAKASQAGQRAGERVGIAKQLVPASRRIAGH